MSVYKILSKIYPFFRPFLGMSFIYLLSNQLAMLIGLAFPWLIKTLIDDVLPTGSRDDLMKIGLTLIAVVVGSAVLEFLSTLCYATMSEKMVIKGRHKLFSELVQYEMSFHDKTEMGEMMTRLMEDSSYLHTLVSSLVNKVITNSLKIIVVLCILWRMNYQMTLLIMCTIPIYLLINKYFGDLVQKQIGVYRGYLSKLVTFFHDVLGKVQLVKNFNYEEVINRKHETLSEDIKKNAVKTEVFGYVAQSLTNITTSLTSVAVLWVGGLVIFQNNALSVGELVAFFTYLNYIFAPTRELASSHMLYQRAKNSVERFFQFIDIRDQYNEHLKETTLKQEDVSIKGAISFENTTFYYNADKPVIEKMNLHIKSGEKVVIYGQSGIGKSTLAKLLKKYYRPVEGDVIIDGNSITNYSLKSLRQQIGYVQQDPKLLCDTIAQNLRIGKLNATEEEMWKVLDTVNLGDFVRSLPEQLETYLPNDGSTVSGGQKQRLAIARLLLQDPQVVILDEFLSNIDPVSQNIILSNLEKWFKDKTVIFISHERLDAKYITSQYIFDQDRKIRPFTEEEALAYWQVASS